MVVASINIYTYYMDPIQNKDAILLLHGAQL